jgi:hypothetical protein
MIAVQITVACEHIVRYAFYLKIHKPQFAYRQPLICTFCVRAQGITNQSCRSAHRAEWQDTGKIWCCRDCHMIKFGLTILSFDHENFLILLMVLVKIGSTILTIEPRFGQMVKKSWSSDPLHSRLPL